MQLIFANPDTFPNLKPTFFFLFLGPPWISRSAPIRNRPLPLPPAKEKIVRFVFQKETALPSACQAGPEMQDGGGGGQPFSGHQDDRHPDLDHSEFDHYTLQLERVRMFAYRDCTRLADRQRTGLLPDWNQCMANYKIDYRSFTLPLLRPALCRLMASRPNCSPNGSLVRFNRMRERAREKDTELGHIGGRSRAL